MLDFMEIVCTDKKGIKFIEPIFVCKSRVTDIMVKGGKFYGVWDEKTNSWIRDWNYIYGIVDRDIEEWAKEHDIDPYSPTASIKWARYQNTGISDRLHRFVEHDLSDCYIPFDSTLVFKSDPYVKENYSTHQLNYDIAKGVAPHYDLLVSTLYSPDERAKFEWAIGAILAGKSEQVQKFFVFYGAMGTGKSTIINIIQQLFDGYYATFNAADLACRSDQFAMETFRDNPLVAIQHDGDLSKIDDNTRLNSIVSHEVMTIKEKYKTAYPIKLKTLLFMGSNKEVKITDAKSGLLRRLIDIRPTGKKLDFKTYDDCMNGIKFELGAIAYRCRELYLSSPHRYDSYKPMYMMETTNDFYNFMLENYKTFEEYDYTTKKLAYSMYKAYCEDSGNGFPLRKLDFGTELRNYFREYTEEGRLPDGSHTTCIYSGFKTEMFNAHSERPIVILPEDSNETETDVDPFYDMPDWLQLKTCQDPKENVFNKECADCPAQYNVKRRDGIEGPAKKWDNNDKVLSDLKTDQVHFVKVPSHHIVIDFDIPGEDGEKDLHTNLEAARAFPKTYCELSKSGKGVHLHYIYDGDPSMLSPVYADHVEVKVFFGNASLRRRLGFCNSEEIRHINSGLPMRKKGANKEMVDWEAAKSEAQLRKMIDNSMHKVYKGNTKPEMDFMKMYMASAFESGLKYDLRDLRPAVMNFAANSSHQSDRCIEIVCDIKWCSDEEKDKLGEATDVEKLPAEAAFGEDDDSDIIFFDVEVFPNLFVVCWKKRGSGGRETVVRLINPSPYVVKELCDCKLVGFNNRKYDNYIMLARTFGYSNEKLFELSQRVIDDSRSIGFKEAAKLSYTDIYDFAATKQSLKKWEIQLGIHHQELGLPWDKPVPQELWEKVADYCVNDVMATEAVFEHLSGDFAARKILAKIAGGIPNDTTNQLTTKIIFGKERHPVLVYTDLATGEMSDGGKTPGVINKFPGYEFVKYSESQDHKNHNMYRGVDLGFGGYVYSNPGIWWDVALIDVRSMHPFSAINLRYFGSHTERFKELVEARGYVKHRNLEVARKILDGALAPFLPDDVSDETLDQLALALKIAINSVYGLTSAKFDNPFRDSRNQNNIVALRGALFMKTLQDEVAKRGFTVAHIKTDSIKIPNATPEIIQFCMDFAKKYGYEFEHEATYKKMCLVNDAVYIAKYMDVDECEEKYGYIPGDNIKQPKKHGHQWTATGTQFQVPYVFKTLFTHEDIEFSDLCETKSVQTSIYVDMNEDYEEECENLEKEKKKFEAKIKKSGIDSLDPNQAERYNYILGNLKMLHNYKFVGKVGQFCPIKPGCGGGVLCRENGDKMDSVTGAKGYRWLESEVVKSCGKEADIDLTYYDELCRDAVKSISEYGDAEGFMEA
jgi:hypothetical protein